MEDWRENPRVIPDLESVQQQIVAAGQHVYGTFVNGQGDYLRHFPVNSPIEATFSVWWGALLYTHEISEDDFYLASQVTIDCRGRQYRLDFYLIPQGKSAALSAESGVSLPRIAVECDGHDYHERTREQVIDRNERDRNLQSDGWIVLHFSGSELHRDPYKCVLAVYEEACSRYWAFERAALAAIRAAEQAVETVTA